MAAEALQEEAISKSDKAIFFWLKQSRTCVFIWNPFTALLAITASGPRGCMHDAPAR
jgi:hypothetical protein